MIGDIKLYIKKFFEQFLCEHDYILHVDIIFLRFDRVICSKCGRSKWV